MASSNEIEREVENQRAQVEQTLGALKDKMSFGQMVDEFGGYVGAEDGRQALRNVGRQVRENPIAFGLVGVGLAWMMLGSGGRSRRDEDWDDSDDDVRGGQAGYGGGAEAGYPGAPGGVRYGSTYGTPYAGAGQHAGADAGDESGSTLKRAARAVGGVVSEVGDRLSGVASGVSEAASSMGETVSSAAGGVGERLSGARHAGQRRMRDLGDSVGGYMPEGSDVSRYGRRMRGALEETIERQPLLVGAVAVALGAAIGAALPTTRAEHRWLGERRDDLIDEAKRTAADLGDQAMEAAKAGIEAATRTAQDEGLAPEPGGKTLAARVETVVRAGVEGAKERLGDEERAPETVGDRSA